MYRSIKNTHILLTVVLSMIVSNAVSQSFSLGGKRWGIAFGNPFVYSGIRINVIDLKESHRINGINFSVYTRTCQTNGIQLSLVSDANNNYDSGPNSTIFCSSNGVKMSCISKDGTFNGLQASLFNYCRNYNGNGVLIGILNTSIPDKENSAFALHNGLLLGLLNYGFITKGVQIGAFNINSSSSVSVGLINYERSCGTQIGLINVVEENSGVQIGAVNIRRSNIPFARLLPLLNVRWK